MTATTMPKETEAPEIATGCLIEPPPPHLQAVEAILGAAGDVPDEFIVPFFRPLFDATFKRAGSALRIKNQRGIPSCVGESLSYQKAADEGVEMSGRDNYRLAKRKDGTGDPTSWGTSIWAGLDAQVDWGIAEEAVVPDISDRPIAEYVSLADVTPAVEANRAKHKSKRGYFVPRTEIVATLWQTQRPVVTSCVWYTNDNAIGPSGVMGMPSGTSVGGHAFCVVGVVRRGGVRCLAVLNSWSEAWGDKGVFYIPLDGVLNRLGNGYVSVDMEASLADVLAKFAGKIVKVKGDPRLWSIEGGKRRHFENEAAWWAHGKLFVGTEVFDIGAAELEVIPEGEKLTWANAKDAHLKELVREAAGLWGKTVV